MGGIRVDIKEKYDKVRSTQINLYNKIIDMLEDYYYAYVLREASKMDFKIKERQIQFERENEFPYIMDYFIHEYKINGKRISELYKQKAKDLDELEKEILENMDKSFATLYRVVNVVEKSKVVFLMDTMNKVKNIKLTDIGYSETIDDSKILFTRVIQVDGLYISAGMSFVYDKAYEKKILDSIKIIKNRNLNGVDEIREVYKIMKRADDQFGIECTTE